jgi:signal transduction histidine kinase
MGGELAFDENDPRGTVVTIRLPGATAPAVAANGLATAADAD